MSEISVYDIVPTPKLADKLIGTSVGGVIPDVTYNFTLEELLQLFIPNIPANNLQGVLDYGNTATQDINLTGTINTTDLNVFATASILDSILSGETHITGELYDGLDSKGTAGQVLTSTGSGVEWYTIPTIIPTLQQVLTSGNTADKNIILTANITAITATATNVVSNTSLAVNGVLKDGTASTGSTDQLLSSTGSGVRWVDMPVYNAVSPLLYNNTTKTFSIQVANSSQGGYLSNADWINFDGKQDAIVLTTEGTSGAATFVGNTLNIPVYSPDLSGYVPVSRTLTINGVTYDLSANRSWTVDAGVAEVTATAPLSSSGGAYPDISISQSNSSTDGYLSSADWLAFNSKQDALGGTGLVKSTAGTITYITDNSTNWNTAYNESIISAEVTGTATKTLTLNQQDGGTIQASWSDIDTGLTSVGLSMPSAFTVTNSPLTSNGTIGVTGAGTTAQYVRGDGSLATFPTIAPEAATLVTEVYNNSGATLTKGTVVYINGGQGNLPTVAKALATGDATSAQTYGVVQVDITNMNNGHVVVIGSLGDLDTRDYSNGTQLYLSSTTAGAWTAVKQYAPAHLVYVGVVVRSHPTQGVVEIKIQNGYEMDELHNVYAQNPNNNAILQYKTATSLWTSVDGTTTNIAEGTNLYYLDSRARAALSFSAGSGAYNSTTGVITIPTNTNQLTNGASFITLASLSAASPLSYDNSIGAFSISQSGASTNGYLSSTDWNTFNNKQVAGNYITSLTGEATGTGPGATAVTLNNASVTGKVLTGVNITGGTVLATDTMLTAFGKLQNQINGLIGSTIYQGTWNASTNTPALASSVGTRGYYYIVNVAGNTNLNGITDWQVGDWAIFDGTAWQKVDNTESVTSVNGFTGAVSLTTDNIAEGTTNLYFSNASARAAISLTTTGTSGAATYNNTTGVINIPQYQSVLTNPITGTLTANYIPKATGANTIGNSIISEASGAITVSGAAVDNYVASFINTDADPASTGIYVRSDGPVFVAQNSSLIQAVSISSGGNADFAGNLTANKYTKIGGTSSQFLMADGSVSTGPNLSGYVPYTGATTNVNLGTNSLTATGITIAKSAGVSTITFPAGTNDSGFIQHIESTPNTGIMRFSVGDDNDTNDYFAFGNTNVPDAFRINANGAVSAGVWQATPITDTYISSAATWNAKQNAITLTTTGSSGAATFTSNTLNIPNYGSALSGYLPLTGGTLTGTLNGTIINTTGYSRFYNVGVGGAASGTYAAYSDAVIGFANLHLVAQTGGAVYVNSAIALPFYINPMGGNVTIGTATDAGYKLDVAGTGRFGDNTTINGTVIVNRGKSGSGIESLDALYLRNTGTGAIGDSINIKFVSTGGTYIASIAGILGSDNIAYGSIAFNTRNYWTDSIVEVMRLTNKGDVCVGTISNPYTSANRGSIFLNGASNSLYGWGIGGSSKGYMYHEGTNVYMENSVSGGSFNIVQVGNGTTQFINNGATRLVINGSGQIIASNNGQFRIAAYGNYRLNNDSDGLMGYLIRSGAWKGNTENNIAFATDGPYGISFFTNGTTTERLHVTSVGNIIIGNGTTDNGTARLQVNGGILSLTDLSYSAGYALYPRNASVNDWWLGRYVNSGTEQIQNCIGQSGTNNWRLGYYNPSNSSYNTTTIITALGAATFSSSVTATSFFESSDFRLKTLIESNPIVEGIENLQCKLYEKDGKIELGYFAQDAELIMPYAVTKNADGFLNLSYREVHTAKISRLERELEELKARLN